MKKYIILTTLVVVTIFISSGAMAVTNNTSNATNSPPKTSREHYNKIPVSVIYKNTDQLGKALAFRLEEKIVSSPLFRPAKKGEKKIIIVLNSSPEFKNNSSPLRSLYSVVWTFFYQEDTLTSYLGNALGLLSLQSLPLIAEDIMARTISLAREYGYLFSNSH